jgi:DNA polymerase-3 subunit epsilon
MKIIPFFTSIHVITMEDVENASTFNELKDCIFSFIGKDYLVAHNASFDQSVFIASLDHYGLEDEVPEFECSLEWSRRAWSFLENHKLHTVSKYLGIDLNHHEALSDAIACSKIYIEAKARIPNE